MKVIALTLATLCLAGVAQAYSDYTLQCTYEEVGIRWPSYYSNSQYYYCQQQGGKPFVYTCPPGEVFTFVLQSCTSPKKFIPPPPLETLPTSAPSTGSSSVVRPQPLPIEEPKPWFPRPIHEHETPLHPPVITVETRPIWELPQNNGPPVVVDVPEHPLPPIFAEVPEHHEEPALNPEEITGPSKPVLPQLPGKKPVMPHLPGLSSHADPDAPLPPTPEPTPPVVKDSPKKPAGKKPLVPGANKKQPAKVSVDVQKPNKKQPLKPPGLDGKKKQPPKPEGKKRAPVPPGKA